jgi:FkbM family methyltransferase
MNSFRKLGSIVKRKIRNYSSNANLSYAQVGEDLILKQLFSEIGISKPSYLDIGAHHPSYLSNTYLFYLSGSKGVCVEPDPALQKNFVTERPRDMLLPVGVGLDSGVADFYVMSTPTLNTFSFEDAEKYSAGGVHKIENKIQVQIKTLCEIISDYFQTSPDLISIDIEGWDYVLLKNYDFSKLRPPVFCLETLTYTDDKSERKLTELIDLMHANNYLTYADTYINTIFVDREVWASRG